MEILELSKHQLLEVSPWKESGVRAGFSTRKGGFSEPPFDSMNLGIHVHDQKEHVLKNRQRFSELIDTNLDQWKSLNQVNSDQIVDLSEPYDDQQYIHHDPKENADGMITNVKGDVLTAFYADCVPLLFKSKNSKWIGVAHAGWKGTVQEIGPKMIQRFGEKGIKPAEMEVVIGPCISKKNYEVDQRVVDHIPPKYHNEVLTPTTEGHYLLDLKRLNFLYLVDNDLNHDDIYITNYCTYEDEEWLYSYRRDKGKTGRMMAFIYLT